MMRRRSLAASPMSSERTASLLLATSRSRSAKRATGPTKSATPVAIALWGMEAKSASAGSCTITTPPASLMARTPTAPSEPAPDSIIATPSPRPAAMERKKTSMGARRPRGSSKGRALTLSPSITSSRSGGMTNTQFGFSVGLSVTCSTSMRVQPDRISLSALGCSGERCRMTT